MKLREMHIENGTTLSLQHIALRVAPFLDT
jgi:hypothetical protein